MNMEAPENNYPEELGNLICKDEQSHLPPIVVGIASILMGVAITMGMYFYGYQLYGSALFGLSVGGVGLAVAIASHFNGESGKRSLLLFDNAIVLEKPDVATTLMFDELDKFQYARTSIYVNGVYNGDAIEMSFEPAPGSSEEKIVFSATVRNEETYPFDFNRMIDLVSDQMCLKMATDLQDNGHVEWVDKVLISKAGINAPVKSMISSSQQIIPWSEIKEFDVSEGQLKIKLVNAKWSSVKMACRETNFYPGYRLFCQLYELHQHEAAQNAIEQFSSEPLQSV